jgi:hypothetical protein
MAKTAKKHFWDCYVSISVTMHHRHTSFHVRNFPLLVLSRPAVRTIYKYKNILRLSSIKSKFGNIAWTPVQIIHCFCFSLFVRGSTVKWTKEQHTEYAMGQKYNSKCKYTDIYANCCLFLR